MYVVLRTRRWRIQDSCNDSEQQYVSSQHRHLLIGINDCHIDAGDLDSLVEGQRMDPLVFDFQFELDEVCGAYGTVDWSI